MSKRRILLMYISKNSGHHQASLAIENALHQLSDDVETLNVNSFNYTNPILEKIINRTYMSIIRRKPEVWGYLYDNPRVVKKTQKLRDSIHRFDSLKMKKLLEGFKPQAVVCTQAFPCGIVADYKKTFNAHHLLVGVLTDYAPHSYWLYDNIDLYFVPSEETKRHLALNGVADHKIKDTGIPIDPKFKKIIDRRKIFESLGFVENDPVLLIMGGSQGLGPIKEIVRILNNIKAQAQLIIITGDNRKLHAKLLKMKRHVSKKMVLFEFAENIDELMEISTIIISKPGGITVSEALAKGLPILIVSPIPGHETMNTNHLLKNRVAVKIDRLNDLEVYITELLSKPATLANMRERAKTFSKPDSSFHIARTILERIM